MRHIATLGLLLLAGCARSVVPEYEARKAAVLAAPTEVPAGWDGDGHLMLSDALVDRLLGQALDRSGAFTRKVSLGGRAHFTPALRLTALELAPSRACATCVQADVTLDGNCSWRIGNSTGDRPLSGHIVFDAEVEAVREGAEWVVQIAPRKVRRADLELGGRTFRTIEKLAEGTIQDWATEHVFDAVQPLPITRFDAELPLRAVRVRPSAAGLGLELLTEAPSVDLVDAPTVEPGEDWALALSQKALLHAARQASFRKGELAWDVHAEPLSLQIDQGTFVLGLRLWRLKGKGWWRDYTVRGTWTRVDRGFDFQAVEADEDGRSKGARTADPLAALAETRILQAVEDAVSTTLPGGLKGDVGGLKLAPKVTALGPLRDGVRLGGTVALKDASTGSSNRGTSGRSNR